MSHHNPQTLQHVGSVASNTPQHSYSPVSHSVTNHTMTAVGDRTESGTIVIGNLNTQISTGQNGESSPRHSTESTISQEHMMDPKGASHLIPIEPVEQKHLVQEGDMESGGQVVSLNTYTNDHVKLESVRASSADTSNVGTDSTVVQQTHYIGATSQNQDLMNVNVTTLNTVDPYQSHPTHHHIPLGNAMLNENNMLYGIYR